MKRNLIYHTHISANEPVLAATDSNHDLLCQLDSLSKNGATITCDRQSLEQLLPKGMDIAPKKPTKFSISFKLDENTSISGTCKVTSARRISRDTFLLDTEFDGLNEDQLGAIESFVECQLQQSRNGYQAVA